MRSFRNTGEMVGEVEREIFEMGINNHPQTMQDEKVSGNPNFDTKELMGYSYALSSWDDLDSIFLNYDNPSIRKKGLPYCLVEHTDRISRLLLNPGTSWVHRKEVWERFLEPDNKFSYTYSERITPQIDRVITELTKNPGSRQCVLTFYDRHDDLENLGGKRRIPCSMYYQFLQREIHGEQTLSLIYTMRSCDFYNHFPIDVYLAIKMLEYVAEAIGAKPLNFVHFMGSLHAYAKDQKYRRIF